MSESITTYLEAVARTWNVQEGELVAQLISLRDKHVHNLGLQFESPESLVSLVERILVEPIDEIVAEHMKVIYYLSQSRK